jgi:ABC-type Zn uptake system ZnuABC Zn-binding protein ZnuA
VNIRSTALRWVAAVFVVWAVGLPEVPFARAQRLQVCCSVPDLASLVQAVGGDHVSVTAFAKGTEDPHFIEAKPGFVKSLSQANLLVMLGLGMEDGWSPVVIQSARNGAIVPGGPGYLDASTAIRPLDVPTGVIDRSLGDVHAGGNPHYLLDPLCGMQVARLIRDKLGDLSPGQKAHFQERYEAFCQRTGEMLVGEALARKYKPDDIPKLALLFEHGRLQAYLKSQNEDSLLGGWLGMMAPYYGVKVVDDHNMWPYFARRFGIRVVAHMEPKPGVTPTTQHLGTVAQQMRAEQVRIVLANPYYDPRHAQFLASNAGAKVVEVAHQVGSRPGTDDYLSMVDYNVRRLAAALASLRGGQ